MRAAAVREGIGYLARSADWLRRAEVDDFHNILMVAEGEVLRISDVHQALAPIAPDRTLGMATTTGSP